MEQESSISKGMVAGMIGGFFGAWAMDRFQALLSKLQPQNGRQSGGDPGTVKAAVAIYEGVLHSDIPPDKKEMAGNVMHYAMGTGSGGVYGLLAESAPRITAGCGVAFGTALWLAADELAVPALHLSKAPSAYAASIHFQALASHIVYGVSTDLARRGLRKLFR
jgi:hypothetical protein